MIWSIHLSYELMLALGLLFLTIHYLLVNATVRIVFLVIAAVAFLFAAVFVSLGNPWEPSEQVVSLSLLVSRHYLIS